MVGVLLGGPDARVAEEHGVEKTAWAGIVVIVSRHGFSTPVRVGAGLAGRVSVNERFSTPRGLGAQPVAASRRWRTPGTGVLEEFERAAGVPALGGQGGEPLGPHRVRSLGHVTAVEEPSVAG